MYSTPAFGWGQRRGNEAMISCRAESGTPLGKWAWPYALHHSILSVSVCVGRIGTTNHCTTRLFELKNDI